MNIKDILIKKAEQAIRLIAEKDSNASETSDYKPYLKGDEIGIEAIDFSIGSLRCANKTKGIIFDIYYDKATGILVGDFSFKENFNALLYCNCIYNHETNIFSNKCSCCGRRKRIVK